jgi:hypothetical protein
MQTWNSMNTKIESRRKLYCFERDRHASVAYLCPSLFAAMKNLDSLVIRTKPKRHPKMHHYHGYKHETVYKNNTARLQYMAHGPRSSCREHGVVFVCAKRRKSDWSGESFLRTCCDPRIPAPEAHPRNQLSSNTCQHIQTTHQTVTSSHSIEDVLADRQFSDP